MDLLHEDMHQDKGRQNLNGKMTAQDGPHKLRASIRRNAYDFQSYAKVERWNGQEWKLVESFNLDNLGIAAHSYTQAIEKWGAVMRLDLIAMLGTAFGILEGRKVELAS